MIEEWRDGSETLGVVLMNITIVRFVSQSTFIIQNIYKDSTRHCFSTADLSLHK